MSWKKSIILAVALLMVAPTVLVASPAFAQSSTDDRPSVPIAPTVKWTPQTNQVQRLYVDFERADNDQDNAEPDCIHDPTNTNPYRLSFAPRPHVMDTPSGQGTRSTCAFAASGSQLAVPSSAVFQTAPLVRDFNVTGNKSLIFNFQGRLPEGWTLNVLVQSGDRVGRTGTCFADPNLDADTFEQTSCVIDNIRLDDTGRYTFFKGERLKVTVSASAPAGTLPVATNRWELSDTSSYLEIRSDDALRAATWSVNEHGVLADLFRPLPRDAQIPQSGLPRIVGVFAVDSAFGYGDAAGRTPTFTLAYNGAPYRVGPNGDGDIPARINRSLSQQDVGRAVWTFEDGYLDYRGFETGEYNLLVDMPYHQGGALKYGVTHKIVLGSAGARLGAYPGETLSHEVLPGSTTTYLLALNNTGRANDSFRITTRFVSGTPATGWSAVVGGPNVLNRQVHLEPNAEKFVALTVYAPNANPGDSSIFLVQAESTLDPGAEKQELTVATRIGTSQTREVDVILPRRGLEIEPGRDYEFPVYAWNKGVRPANVTLTIQTSAPDEWAIDFVQGSQTADRVVLSNIPPGGIAETTLRVNGPIGLQSAPQQVTVNATLAEDTGIARDRSVTFTLNPTASVKLDIVQPVRFVELSTCAGGGDGGGGAVPGLPGGSPSISCDEDDDDKDNGVDGIWYRVWITNTGRRSDEFDVRIDERSITGCDRTTSPRDNALDPNYGRHDQDFNVFFRDANGVRQSKGSIVLGPSQTGELYVWRAVNTDGDPCSSPYRFVVHAEGRQTGVVARQEVSLRPENTGGTKMVLLEAVQRKDGYDFTTPYVDVTHAQKRVVTGGIEVGRNATFYVRVTNGASFKSPPGAAPNEKSDVRVDILFDQDSGWNVSMRPRIPEPDVQKNPYRYVDYFGNVRENVAEAWIDREYEVVVEPPKNKTLPAGLGFPFFVQARLNGSSDTSTLQFQAVVTQFANVSLVPDAERTLAHPGEAGPYLLTLFNNGSSEALVNLRAFMNPDNTPDRGLGWTVVLGANQFVLPANTNRTVALLVTPPPGAVPSDSGEVNVTVEYKNNQLNDLLSTSKNRSYRLFTDVVPQDSLNLQPTDTTVTAAPGGFANFTMTLSSSREVNYRLNASAIPGWTRLVDGVNPERESVLGRLGNGESRTITLVLAVPQNAVNGSTYSTVLRVHEVSNPENFDAIPVTINIQGGKAIASLSLPAAQKTVDRGASRDFEINVVNIGNAAGRVQLELRVGDASWSAGFSNVNDSANPYVDLGPNQLARVNVTVRAPLQVPENTVVPIEVIAHAPGLTQSARALIQARIHDYALSMTLAPASVDLVAGTASEIVIKLKNRGNDNDTLNVSYVGNLDLPEWRVEIPTDRVFLEPGAERELRARIQSPTEQLPTPRSYNFKFYAGTLGGAAVNVTKNDTATAAVTVLRYVAMDVDGDDILELAVDFDKRNGNGYEQFREISGDGVQTQVVEATLLDGRTRFLLDTPNRGTPGVADAWFDPENVFTLVIRDEHAIDVTNDRAPDYLLDTDRDIKVDRTYDTETDRYLTTVEIKVYGDDRIQYLIDTRGDARFDRFYDPATKKVTDTQRVAGQPSYIVGIDTDDDKTVDKYYNPQTGSITSAEIANVADFFVDYWYFFVVFAAMLVVTIVVVVRRHRRD